MQRARAASDAEASEAAGGASYGFCRRGNRFTVILRLDEGEQLFVDLVFKRRAHAMRGALEHL